MKIRKLAATLVAAAVLTLLAGNGSAQENGGGGRGGRPGGFGGPGGGGGDPAIALLGNEKIREEIDLMPDQVEALKKIRDEVGARGERPDFDFRNATEEERTAFFEKMQAAQKERAKKMREQLEEVLLPEQLTRLQELSIQIRGVGALQDEEVQKELGITDEQKKKFETTRETIQTEMREKMRELMASGDREKMREAFGNVRTEMEAKVMEVLTSDQKKKFEEMKGEAFEMPEELRGGMMRGGPGGGGDRGPGGPGGGDRGRGGPGGNRGGSRPQSDDSGN